MWEPQGNVRAQRKENSSKQSGGKKKVQHLIIVRNVFAAGEKNLRFQLLVTMEDLSFFTGKNLFPRWFLQEWVG